ncbi:MAG: amylo-alpha-1,6-glucosidase [Chlamydiales bacterium]|nr:amylo-alpha-1,6-glucosidase [Chlamydiales bacterium]
MLERKVQVDNQDISINREWLLTNGLGGYSSTSLGGALTRKYHGLLVAALPSPLGRTIALNHSEDTFFLPDKREVLLSTQEFVVDGTFPVAPTCLKDFRLENGLPFWHYEFEGFEFEKSIILIHDHNTVHITYKYLKGSAPVEFRFRPFLSFRHHEASVLTSIDYQFAVANNICRINPDGLPDIFLYSLEGVQFTSEPKELQNVFYRIESERGYDCVGKLTSPGFFSLYLKPGEEMTFIASTESWESTISIDPITARHAENERRESLLSKALHANPQLEPCSLAQELVLAADQFIINPATRVRDNTLLRALGQQPRTVIAGYHWFTDWGRDAMISLEGLTMVTGRYQDAVSILRTFSHYVHQGLIPNMFPDEKEQGLYHTADATLWFMHAVDRYLATSGDTTLLADLLPKLESIMQYHITGTLFGIHCDEEDGLLIQGAEGYALTWMDAKVGDLVVTPRRGKAVEINALWYNALRLMAKWTGNADYATLADKCYKSFNEKFWYAEQGYLYDVLSGENKDSACRPNQIFSISLPHPVLDRQYWEPVLNTVKNRILSRVGLRSLAPGHPDYKVLYLGNLFLRDSAYHQGTVWGWLIGPFIDAWLRVYPDQIEEATVFLGSFKDILSQGCIGTVDEIFDAQEPNLHRGCVAQAWSVAEVLRSWNSVLKIKQDSLRSG